MKEAFPLESKNSEHGASFANPVGMQLPQDEKAIYTVNGHKMNHIKRFDSAERRRKLAREYDRCWSPHHKKHFTEHERHEDHGVPFDSFETQAQEQSHTESDQFNTNRCINHTF